MKSHKIAVFFAGILLATTALADVLQLKEGHPETYVVKKGDTLWDISGVFLQKPWLWPRLWQINPQVKDPHWIYPGDILNLVWVDGEPRLVHKKVIRLSPSIKKVVKEDPIPSLKLSAVAAFLRSDHIFSGEHDVDSMPYVLGNNQNDRGLMEEQHIYVKGNLPLGGQYGIYHPGVVYKDRNSGEELGRQGVLAGIAVAVASHPDDVTEVALIKNMREVMQGDRVMAIPANENLDITYQMQPSALKSDGYIIDFPGTSSSVSGKYDVILLSKGARDGLKNGDVITIKRPGVALTGHDADTISYRQNSNMGQRVLDAESRRLPADVIGQAMTFKVYDKVAMALVLRANDIVHKDYTVSNPD
ncbi:LysM peptidoglycan-binding domain-containing protein [Pseudaeromonas sharmana]|uniref:LysM peptidoglycan-binding domain-containing protein n=1 Tax=Pseudaeromonas sharmana TaxID=328412 RepID=A0ABV8CMM4_9GAMM